MCNQQVVSSTPSCPLPGNSSRQVIDTQCAAAADWRRPVGRPRTTWLSTIDDDLQSLNFGVHTAWRKARDRAVWHQVVSMATLHPVVLYTPGGSTLWLWLGGRQEIGPFGIKSSVRQRSTLEFANKEERRMCLCHQAV